MRKDDIFGKAWVGKEGEIYENIYSAFGLKKGVAKPKVHTVCLTIMWIEF